MDPIGAFLGLFGLAAAAGGSSDDSGQTGQGLSDYYAEQERQDRAAQRDREQTQREYERQLYSPPPVGEKTNVP
jgi:hypothetical protein